MTTLKIDAHKLAGDFKKEFSGTFPFLKIELFREATGTVKGKKNLTSVSNNQEIGLGYEQVDFDEKTSVRELKLLLLKIGIMAQVFRKSGAIWIETSLTDDWSLEKQNHEAELINKHSI